MRKKREEKARKTVGWREILNLPRLLRTLGRPE